MLKAMVFIDGPWLESPWSISRGSAATHPVHEPADYGPNMQAICDTSTRSLASKWT